MIERVKKDKKSATFLIPLAEFAPLANGTQAKLGSERISPVRKRRVIELCLYLAGLAKKHGATTSDIDEAIGVERD